jgi:predicted ATPase
MKGEADSTMTTRYSEVEEALLKTKSESERCELKVHREDQEKKFQSYQLQKCNLLR